MSAFQLADVQKAPKNMRDYIHAILRKCDYHLALRKIRPFLMIVLFIVLGSLLLDSVDEMDESTEVPQTWPPVPARMQVYISRRHRNQAENSSDANKDMMIIKKSDENVPIAPWYVNDILLVLFTTFIENKAVDPMHDTVIKNWEQLEGIKLVLFADQPFSPLAREVAEHGWDVLPIPRKNKFSHAYLADMYSVVYKKYNASFYGYTGSDILFPNELSSTLQAVGKYFGRQHQRKIFISGHQRKCTTVEATDVEWLSDPDVVRNIAIGQSLSKRPDFFLTTRKSFPWTETAPNVVVNTPGLHNHLLTAAYELGLDTVDISDPVVTLCLRCSYIWPNATHAELVFNKLRYSKEFNYQAGILATFRYNTQLVTNGSIVVQKRSIEDMMNSMPKSLSKKFYMKHVMKLNRQ